MSESKPPLTKPNRMVVEYLDGTEIRSNPIALRQCSKPRIKQFAKHIEAFGLNLPLLVDARGFILAGEEQFGALKQLAWTEFPAIRVSHLTEPQRVAFVIAHNRLAETAKWDEQVLGVQLKILSAMDLDFDLELTGFSMGEIDLKIGGLNDGKLEEEALPQPAGRAVSQLGDLWILGSHRLLCGNALESQNLNILMDGQKAAQVFSDPPYNVKIDGHVSGLGKNQHREFEFASGEMSATEFTSFLTRTIENMTSHVIDGTLLYIFMDWRHISELLVAAATNGLQLINLCIWAKPNGGMGSLYRSQHELVFVFKQGKAPHQNNISLGKYGRNRSNVWNYEVGPGFGRAGEEGNLAALHPTPKPFNLVADAILDTSSRGEIILDLFLGSGTTLIAAERVGRRCFGMEIDPIYSDVIIRRWQNFTGEHAMHSANGETFNDIAERRSTEVAA